MQKIKKGDEVIIIAGKDKGRRGIVLAVLEKGLKFLIEGINLIKKHTKSNPNANEQGGILTKPSPIHRSNVMLYNPATQKGGRVGVRVLGDGRRVRYFKKTNEDIEI